MPISRPAATKRCVVATSSGEGSGSPDGWLWYRMTPAAPARMAWRKRGAGATAACDTVPLKTTASWMRRFFASRRRPPMTSCVSRDSLSKKNLLSDPASVGRYLVQKLAGETQEVMGGLLLDSKNRLVRDAPLFRGTLTHASVAPAPLFRQAILAGAAGVILYHNHPSGDPEPSPEDLATTQRFAAAGREIGIEVKDHLVIGRGRVVSFHERGLLGR